MFGLAAYWEPIKPSGAAVLENSHPCSVLQCYRKARNWDSKRPNVFAGEILIDANRLFPVASNHVPTIAVRHTPPSRIPPPPPAYPGTAPTEFKLQTSHC